MPDLQLLLPKDAWNASEYEECPLQKIGAMGENSGGSRLSGWPRHTLGRLTLLLLAPVCLPLWRRKPCFLVGDACTLCSEPPSPLPASLRPQSPWAAAGGARAAPPLCLAWASQAQKASSSLSTSTPQLRSRCSWSTSRTARATRPGSWRLCPWARQLQMCWARCRLCAGWVTKGVGSGSHGIAAAQLGLRLCACSMHVGNVVRAQSGVL